MKLPFQPPTARDLLSSAVVFLVALPLCMGIAVASGAPPALGLVTGVVAGLVVGFAAGAPLQVSGPAAGLAVLVWELIETWGLESLGVMVLLAGAIQFVAGLLGLGRVFRAVSPSVVHGMLAGIGVLIFGSQFHVMLDHAPGGDGLHNLLGIPAAVHDALLPLDGSRHQQAALVGAVTILGVVLWNTLRPKVLKAVPGPLVGVVLGAGLAAGLGLEISMVSVPAELSGVLNVPNVHDAVSLATEPDIWLTALALAAVASAESLLSATATDQLHDGPRADYDREMAAQGLGNILCGALGALPMTGVIVRSSANVEAGAKTRWSAIFHGAWLLLTVAFLPQLLGLIPMASLAAILVYIGFRLVKPAHVRELLHYGRGEVAIYAATLVTIVAVDLLSGVGVGLALAVARLVWKALHLHVEARDEGDHHVLKLVGHASFVTLPKLATQLEGLPAGAIVRVDLQGVQYLDHACVDLLQSWSAQHTRGGGRVIGWPGPAEEELAPVPNPSSR